MNFRFAHISDLHLPPLPAGRPIQLANKRLLGYLSWHRKRKHRHRPEVVAALEKDLAGQGVDHICITGDITNLGLPLEFQAADRWLDDRAPQETITFVPGNHDAYIAASVTAMHAHFRRWIPPVYPFVHRRNGVVFIGVSTAVATAPFLASGRIGNRQLARLESLLNETVDADTCRVLLLHHPVATGVVKRRKALVDREDLNRLLQRRPVDLVLHGHGHRAVHYQLPAAGGDVPVFGAGAASLYHRDLSRTGHYHVFTLNHHELRVTHHHYRPAEGCFTPSAETVLPRRR